MLSINIPVQLNDISDHLNQIENLLFPIEIEIVKNLYGKCINGYRPNREDKWKSNTYWTNIVKDTLHLIGSNNGYLVYPKRKNDEKKTDRKLV